MKKHILLTFTLANCLLSFAQTGIQLQAQIGIIVNQHRQDSSGLIALTVNFHNASGKDIFIPMTSNVLKSKTGAILSIYQNDTLYKELDIDAYAARLRKYTPPSDPNIIIQTVNNSSLVSLSQSIKQKFNKYIIDSIALINAHANDYLAHTFLKQNSKSDSVKLRYAIRKESLFIKQNATYKNYFVVLLDVRQLQAGSYEIRYEPSLNRADDTLASIDSILNYKKFFPEKIHCPPLLFIVP